MYGEKSEEALKRNSCEQPYIGYRFKTIPVLRSGAQRLEWMKMSVYAHFMPV